MAGRFPFEKLVKYPHMKPEDVAVWERFIEKNPDFFELVDYDVCVGKGRDDIAHTCEKERCGCNKLHQKKIDVVGYRQGELWVVEVKPLANMRGLGQIIAYEKLFRDQAVPGQTIKSCIVAEAIENEMTEIFELQGVAVLLA